MLLLIFPILAVFSSKIDAAADQRASYTSFSLVRPALPILPCIALPSPGAPGRGVLAVVRLVLDDSALSPGSAAEIHTHRGRIPAIRGQARCPHGPFARFLRRSTVLHALLSLARSELGRGGPSAHGPLHPALATLPT